MDDKKRAGTLRPAQIRHLLRVTAATSRLPERDALVLLLGHTCAMRVTEIARLLVSDVLMPSGAIRREVSLRADITKGCRQRCVFISHEMAIEALEAYIEHRWTQGLGTEFTRAKYRGLRPGMPLILSFKGTGLALTAKKRTLAGGVVEQYLACDALQSHVTRLYKDAGLHDCSSHTGRRTFATRLVAQGVELDVVRRLLGHADLDHSDPYIQPSKATLREMFEVAI